MPIVVMKDDENWSSEYRKSTLLFPTAVLSPRARFFFFRQKEDQRCEQGE
jgi:hypothetical protein